MNDENFVNKIAGMLSDPEESLFYADESEWEKLEKRLDQDDERKRPLWIWYAAASVLVASLLLYFLIVDQTTSSPGLTSDHEIMIEELPDGHIPGDEMMIAERPDSKVEIEKEKVKKEKEYTQLYELNYQKDIEKSTNLRDAAVYQPGNTANTDDQKNQIILPEFLTSNHSNIFLSLPLKTLPPVMHNLTESEIKFPEIESGRNVNSETKKFEYTFSVKPMASSVSLEEMGRMNAAVGGALRVNITDHTNLELGTTYANQTYRFNGNDYTGIDRYWDYYTNSELPLSVMAKNHIIEFPVSINHNIIERESGQNLSAGVGVNNIYKFYEQHDFTFGDYANPDNQKQWSLEENNIFLLNGLKLKAGYETKLSKNMNIQIEPFIDIPLRENAWGELQINNKGIAINISPRN